MKASTFRDRTRRLRRYAELGMILSRSGLVRRWRRNPEAQLAPDLDLLAEAASSTAQLLAPPG